MEMLDGKLVQVKRPGAHDMVLDFGRRIQDQAMEPVLARRKPIGAHVRDLDDGRAMVNFQLDGLNLSLTSGCRSGVNRRLERTGRSRLPRLAGLLEAGA